MESRFGFLIKNLRLVNHLVGLVEHYMAFGMTMASMADTNILESKQTKSPDPILLCSARSVALLKRGKLLNNTAYLPWMCTKSGSFTNVVATRKYINFWWS